MVVFLWYNRDTYLENVIPLLINALPVAGLFCGIITAIEIIRNVLTRVSFVIILWYRHARSGWAF